MLSCTFSVLVGSFSHTQPKIKSSGEHCLNVHGLFRDLLGKGVRSEAAGGLVAMPVIAPRGADAGVTVKR